MKTAAAVLGVLAIFAVAIWWQFYRYDDCKRVGHSTMYCIGSIGK